MDHSVVVLERPPAGAPCAGDEHASAEPLSRAAIAMLAAACGLVVANANYAQPLLVAMGQSLHLRGSMLGLIPA